MSFRHVKFYWKPDPTVEVRWRLGLFGRYTIEPGFPDDGLAISLRGVLRLGFVLAVAGYLAAAAALHVWLRRNPYNLVGFTDVLTWPVRRAHVDRLRGRALIAAGLDDLKRQHWGDGIFKLRLGLDKYPDDFDARLLLAEIYLRAHMKDQSLAVLRNGPAAGVPDRRWLEAVLNVADVSEDHAFALSVCESYLPRFTAPEQWGRRQWLLARKLSALTGLGRGPEALALAEAEGDKAGLPVKIQQALTLLALGRPADAATYLSGTIADAALPDQPDLLRLQAQAFREAGRLDDMEQALVNLRSLSPDLPQPWAFGVEQRARAGRGGLAALTIYINRFGTNPDNLLLVARPLAEIPDVNLVQRIVTVALERGQPALLLRVQLAEAQLAHAEWPELARSIAQIAPQIQPVNVQAQQWLDWMKAVSAAVAAPASGPQQTQLVDFLRAHLFSLKLFRMTVTALRRAGRLETAQEVVALGRSTYKESPWLRDQEIELVVELATAKAGGSTPRPSL